eukprot:6017478-Amphidinium_carterae.2
MHSSTEAAARRLGVSDLNVKAAEFTYIDYQQRGRKNQTSPVGVLRRSIRATGFRHARVVGNREASTRND